MYVVWMPNHDYGEIGVSDCEVSNCRQENPSGLRSVLSSQGCVFKRT